MCKFANLCMTDNTINYKIVKSVVCLVFTNVIRLVKTKLICFNHDILRNVVKKLQIFLSWMKTPVATMYKCLVLLHTPIRNQHLKFEMWYFNQKAYLFVEIMTSWENDTRKLWTFSLWIKTPVAIIMYLFHLGFQYCCIYLLEIHIECPQTIWLKINC